jgi:hypothetical protein
MNSTLRDSQDFDSKTTQKLGKSLIYNILKDARASLKEPSRPFTPGETPRALFTTDTVSRPSSSYNIKTLNADLEPRRTRAPGFEAPIQTTRRTVSMSSRASVTREPVKLKNADSHNPEKPAEIRQELKENIEERKAAFVADDVKDALQMLEKLQQHVEARNLYQVSDVEDFGKDLLQRLRKPHIKFGDQENVLRQMAFTLESFSQESEKFLTFAKYLVKGVTEFNMIYKKKKTGIEARSISLSVVKIIYQFSKNSVNDNIFLERGVLDTLSQVLIQIASDPALELDGDEKALPYEFLIFLTGTLKNITSNSALQRKAVEIHLLPPLSKFLPVLFETDSEESFSNIKRAQLLVQVVAILKNLCSCDEVIDQVIMFQIIEKLGKVLGIFSTNQELVLNTLKVMSKLSSNEYICKILKSYDIIESISQSIATFTTNAFIVSRAAYILANLATSNQDTRLIMGNSVINTALTYGIKEHINKSNRSSNDALLKSTRLIANILLEPQIGRSLSNANEIGVSLLSILNNFDISEAEELILNTTACLTNLSFYDRPDTPLFKDDTRLLILAKTSSLLIQTVNEEETLESARLLGNLTRHEEVCREMGKLRIVEGMNLLLEHGNLEVVYYILGSLINISSQAKDLIYTDIWFEKLINLMGGFNIQEPELNVQVVMIVSNLCAISKGLVPWEGVAGEENVNKLSNLAKELKSACEGDEELADLESVLDGLIDLMPKPFVPCTYPDCGRKFPDQAQLDQHWARRHKN